MLGLLNRLRFRRDWRRAERRGFTIAEDGKCWVAFPATIPKDAVITETTITTSDGVPIAGRLLVKREG